jgi:hypothetical protein
MKPIHPSRFVAALIGLTLAAGSTHAAPIVHYTFDVDNSGTTPDSVGSASATLGGGVAINTGIVGQLGGGVLEMTAANGSNLASVDGAVTSNSFDWSASSARTVTFWWKAKTPVANTFQGTYVSLGTTVANGTRFDIKESNNPPNSSQLRVEVQGAGQSSNPTSFDDGNWHFVAVTVPNAATLADISWFAGVRGGSLSGDLNISTSTQVIATGTGPLVFGDSIISAPDNRTPNGYLDEFQLYDRVLTPEEILFLYQNPGDVISAAANPGITSFTAVGGGMWELTLSGQPSTKYEFRSSTTLDFTPGTLVGGLSQENPGTDPGTVDGSGTFVTTDSNGVAKVRLTLTGEPKDFVRAVSLP